MLTPGAAALTNDNMMISSRRLHGRSCTADAPATCEVTRVVLNFFTDTRKVSAHARRRS
jgi:hypothetical protein